MTQPKPSLSELQAQLQTLSASLEALYATQASLGQPSAESLSKALLEARKPGPTLAPRIEDYVHANHKAPMSELMRSLNAPKNLVHYYARRLAADKKVILAYEPRPSHLALVAWSPERVLFEP